MVSITSPQVSGPHRTGCPHDGKEDRTPVLKLGASDDGVEGLSWAPGRYAARSDAMGGPHIPQNDPLLPLCIGELCCPISLPLDRGLALPGPLLTRNTPRSSALCIHPFLLHASSMLDHQNRLFPYGQMSQTLTSTIVTG